MKAPATVALVTVLCACTVLASAREAPRALQAPVVDGHADDEAWQGGSWVDLKYSILGTTATPDDFNGRYKVVWTPDYLYVLAEITDDLLVDSTPDPLKNYWNDDTLEFFVDEDASGGDHHETDNAYAYHIALDNQVVDIGADGRPTTYPTHVRAAWKRETDHPHRIYWEARIAVFAEGSATSRRLSENETLGFMVAYCDADSSNGRVHFFGDVEIESVNGDRNLGYLDASVFGRLTLTK
jgi:hypothetical protein